MNFEEFKEKIVAEMKQRVGNGEVKLEKIVKNNGVNLIGLVIISPNKKITPTIYLEAYFEKLQGMTFIQVADKIWQTYLDNKDTQEVDVSQFTKWSKAKDRVTVKLINYADNQELLKTIPHEKYLDLAVVYYYLADVFSGGVGTILINNYHLDLWGIGKEELHHVAVSNYKKLYRIEIKSMQDIVAEFLKDIQMEDEYMQDDTAAKMYVVTNHLKLFGATAMLFPEEFQRLADALESDLYILPSSVQEIITIPAFQEDEKCLRSMVGEVNENVVDKVEQLSNSVYRYIRESGRIQVL